MANCANHPQTAAAAYCRTCGKPLCENCKRDVRGVIYCEECIAARLAGDPAVGAAPPPPIPGAPGGGSSPILAAFLGLIPGVGAMFNGQIAKALVHVGIFALLIKLTDDANGLFGLGIAAWIFYMAFEAYHTAKARQLGLPDPDFLGLNKMVGYRDDATLRYNAAMRAQGSAAAAPMAVEPEPENDRTIPAGAYWLIGLGVFFLLANLNIFDLRLGRYLWEFVVIGFGIYIAMGRWTGTRMRGRFFCPCRRCKMQFMTGPAMMITVGVLGLLAATHVLAWRHSWPLFLIVLGAVRLAQMSAPSDGHVDYVPPMPAAAPPTTPTESTPTGGM